MAYEVNPEGRAVPVPGTEPTEPPELPEDEPLTAVLTRLANETALADLQRSGLASKATGADR